MVSVVVSVASECESLQACLEAIREQSYPAPRREVIVVEQRETPGLEKVLERWPAVRWVRSPAGSDGAARNRAVDLSCGDVLVFTSAKCVPAPDWMERGVRHLILTPDCGLVAGRVELDSPDAAAWEPAQLYEGCTAWDQAYHVRRERFGAAENLFTFRRVYDQVGPFLEALPAGSDAEWGRRVYARGYRQVYAHDATVRHPAHRNLGELVRRVRARARAPLPLSLGERLALACHRTFRLWGRAWRLRQEGGWSATLRMLRLAAEVGAWRWRLFLADGAGPGRSGQSLPPAG